MLLRLVKERSSSVNTPEDRQGEKALGVLLCSLLHLTRFNSIFVLKVSFSHITIIILSAYVSACYITLSGIHGPTGAGLPTNIYTKKIYSMKVSVTL